MFVFLLMTVNVGGFTSGAPGCFRYSDSGLLHTSCSSLALKYGLGQSAASASAALQSINPNVTVCDSNDSLLVDSACVAFGDSE